MTQQGREIRKEAERIERNRSRCPITVAVADILFDAARARSSEALEDVAICVDADAQQGVEYSGADLRRLVARVQSVLEKERGRCE